MHDVPIIHPEVRALLQFLCKLSKPCRILEVGTAIGYSAIVFARELPENGRLITVEREPEMTSLALSNIEKANLNEKIRVIEGEALEVLSCLNSKFDLVFIDAAKGYYHEFFELILPLMNDGGLIVSDNVLYKGMTASDDLVKRRQKTIVGRMREYLEMLCNHPKLTTSVLPLGDGVALSYYAEKGK
ncbi:MAG: O-methyltransferase [Clostridia bacterium]|nr:O-methyltransferase [Clostridia bacterium]